MCWQCENPRATEADYRKYLDELMSHRGWMVQGVEGDRLHPPWAYTVGLTAFGTTELVVTGMKHSRAAELLNGLAEHVRRTPNDAPLQPGDRFTPGYADAPRVEVVALEHPDAHLHTAAWLYGTAFRALQLVWADDRGRWPWEVGFRGRRGGQPVLGPRFAA